MRKLVVGSMLLSGCLITENPAWQAGGSTSSGGPASSSGEPETPTATSESETPTTSATDGSATGDGGGSTGLPVTSATEATDTTGATGEATTGEQTTGEPGTTGAPMAVCKGTELVELVMPDGAPQDTGVVPTAMGNPCKWSPSQQDCGPLNFGTTGYFRLVNDDALGHNAALLRFPADAVLAGIAGSGRAPQDLVGARVELVIWEPKAGPAAAFDLQIHLQQVDNFDWTEGHRDAQPAQEDDSNVACRDIDQGNCQQWAQGDALAGALALGVLHVTPELVAMPGVDLDADGGQYHAKLRSEPLGMPLMAAYQAGLSPGLGVTLATRRDLGGDEVGIKLRESEWDNPRLYAEFCTDWDP